MYSKEEHGNNKNVEAGRSLTISNSNGKKHRTKEFSGTKKARFSK